MSARLRYVECADCGETVPVKRGIIPKHGHCQTRAPILDDQPTDPPAKDIIDELRDREPIWEDEW